MTREKTVKECVEDLVNYIASMGYPIDKEKFELKYHMDVGIIVKVLWNGIPSIPIFSDWLQSGTGYDWIVRSIDLAMDEKWGLNAQFHVSFLLTEEI